MALPSIPQYENPDSSPFDIVPQSWEKLGGRLHFCWIFMRKTSSLVHILAPECCGKCETPSDPCPTDLDRILTEGQDPGAQQCLALGTVPIKGKNLGFWVPMHFLY